MSDYLIEKYNAQVAAINGKEADRLHAALETYTTSSNAIITEAVSERFDAGVALAAAMAQRDHEYQKGKPEPVDPEQKSAADRLIDTMNEVMNAPQEMAGSAEETVKSPD